LPEGDPNVGRDCPFRFEAAWTTHENFHRFLHDNWDIGRNLGYLLNNLTTKLKEWNKEVLGNILKERMSF